MQTTATYTTDQETLGAQETHMSFSELEALVNKLRHTHWGLGKE